ncbi:Hydrophobin 2 [Mycena venus]|uniref:Hydrophobin n=1 Tax=Mycena venus TaxID=2733690 RepID=A0A8H6Y9B1_9AGAR|nr:Hydrophobin 2 [Mycena venus]
MPNGSPPPVTPPTPPQCCASVVSFTSSSLLRQSARHIFLPFVGRLVTSLLTGINVPIGLSCSPITVVGNNYGGTTATCEAPKAGWVGLIALNCLEKRHKY